MKPFYEDTDKWIDDSKRKLDYIDEQIRGSINDLILEEDGINSTVRDSCVALYNEICNDIRDIIPDNIEGFDGITKRRGRLRFQMTKSPFETENIKIPATPIKVTYTYYNFANEDVKKLFDSKDDKHNYDCSLHFTNNILDWISLTFYHLK